MKLKVDCVQTQTMTFRVVDQVTGESTSYIIHCDDKDGKNARLDAVLLGNKHIPMRHLDTLVQAFKDRCPFILDKEEEEQAKKEEQA